MQIETNYDGVWPITTYPKSCEQVIAYTLGCMSN